MNLRHSLFVLFILTISCSPLLGAEEFKPLFDGKTLNGWTPLPGGTWQVTEGSIVGSQDKSEARHGMLLSNKQYENFTVRLKYKSLAGNSGFYFRVQKVDHAVSVKGFQAEIDAQGNDVGGLYETLGRDWVTRLNAEQIAEFYKKNQWNEMLVTAIDGNVNVSVNGFTTATLKQDPIARKGYFGLQLHGGQEMHVLFKEIEIKELPATK